MASIMTCAMCNEKGKSVHLAGVQNFKAHARIAHNVTDEELAKSEAHKVHPDCVRGGDPKDVYMWFSPDAMEFWAIETLAPPKEAHNAPQTE